MVFKIVNNTDNTVYDIIRDVADQIFIVRTVGALLQMIPKRNVSQRRRLIRVCGVCQD